MTTPYYADATVRIFHGDCLDVLRELPDASVDAVVTDPPYGLEFMGKEWDGPKLWRDYDTEADREYVSDGRVAPKFQTSRPSFAAGIPFQRWCEAWATECLRVLKPGGHMLAFGGTRTSHRLACAVEDAGFEIRDSIAWLYGSGFPKSLDVSKAIDKAAGQTQPIVGPDRWAGRDPNGTALGIMNDDAWVAQPDTVRGVTAPVTEDARTWQGWGTALKPAHEPIVVARKPLGSGTVAANVLAHGTGALNVDGCRVEAHDSQLAEKYAPVQNAGPRENSIYGADIRDRAGAAPHAAGRWPANVVLDESQAAALDAQSGPLVAGGTKDNRGRKHGAFSLSPRESERDDTFTTYGDDGLGASRYFYVAKADAGERVRIPKAGGEADMFAGSIRKRCTKCGKQEVNVGTSACACPEPDFQPDPSMSGYVAHPTVKPLALMRWLVRLVTPPGGTVLEPFAGSGTTVEACILEGFACIAIEREADYLPLIRQRIHRRRDPVEAVRGSGEDAGLFDLLDGGVA